MADSVLLDGSDDLINFAVGGVGAFGPATFACIVKPAAQAALRQICDAGSADSWTVELSSSDVIGLYNGTATASAVTVTENTWGLVAVTKATGTVAPKMHYYNGSSWSHTTAGTSLANSGSPASQFRIGSNSGPGEWFGGNILIAGYWNTELTDGNIETLIANQAAWEALNPPEAWRFDTMSAIQSFGTTGTADENSRTGTSLDVGDVPTWWDTPGGPALGQQYSWHYA